MTHGNATVIGRTGAGVLAAAIVTLVATTVLAAPCGGVTLDGKRVKLGRAIRPGKKLSATDKACAKAIGKALKGAGRVRSVTIAVRMPNAARLDGSGKKVAAAWASAVAAGGIPVARISTLVPPVRPGGKPEISVAYRAANNRRPVALVQAATGEVRGGPKRRIVILKPGNKLANRDVVSTATKSVTRLALADSSFVVLGPNSFMKLGRIELTRDLKRRVQLDLVRGKIVARAMYKKKSETFQIRTKTGIAGVRGTQFRVGISDDEKRMVVETLEGVVALSSLPDPKTGKVKTVLVPAGKVATAHADGRVTEPRDLPEPPEVEAPFKGPVKRGSRLIWDDVDEAAKYQVEISRDAEFARDVSVLWTKTASLTLDPKRPDGRWYYRVIAVTAADIAGIPSKIYSFDLGQPVPPAAAQPAKKPPAGAKTTPAAAPTKDAKAPVAEKGGTK